MDSIYKKFIIGGILIVILLKLINYREDFSQVPTEDETIQKIYNREKPPFEILKKNDIEESLCFNTDNEYFKADDDYELILPSKRGNWRRERDIVYVQGGKRCNRICEKYKNKKSPYSSYMETKISNYGVINPKIYLRKPRKMLEVYNTNSELVPVIKTSEKLPYNKEGRAAWTCQRDWLCFDPNKLLK